MVSPVETLGTALERREAIAPTTSTKEVLAAIRANELEILPGCPEHDSVNKVLALWRVRSKMVKTRGVSAEGLDWTLESLERLPANDLLEKYACQTSERAAMVFLAKNTGDIVGCITVPRRFIFR